MTCKEFEKLIPNFIAGKLNYKIEARFCNHMDCCKSCNEELEIQYLITEGLNRLESGDTVDIQSGLYERIGVVRRRMRHHQMRVKALLFLETFFVFFIFLLIIWLVL